jgi:predicted regulator of Ras-like GTPase activity (Roadblock/LC7/MglB family)
LNYTYRQDLDWLITDFTARVVDVAHAVVVSADGVPLALSEGIPQFFAEQLAAITAGLVSLMQGAARIFEAGLPTQALVEMEGGLMIVKAISDGSSLAVLAALDCDTDLVAYEMSLLVEAVGDVLTPAARAQGLGAGRQKGPRVDRAFEVCDRADAGVTHGAGGVAVGGS